MADAMVVATGRSARHVSAIAEHVAAKVKAAGYGSRPIEGMATGDWVLVDAGDVVIHIFRPEVRAFYDIEAMWQSGSGDRVAV
jgi:ribosome-associated protein